MAFPVGLIKKMNYKRFRKNFIFREDDDNEINPIYQTSSRSRRLRVVKQAVPIYEEVTTEEGRLATITA